MPDNEVGARLSVKDRARWSSELNRAAKDVHGVGDSAQHVERETRKASTGGLSIFRSSLGGITTAAKVVSTGLAAVVVGIGALTVKVVRMGMDAFETKSKFETVFGDLTPQVQSFISTVNQKFGIPTKDLQDAAATFGVFGKSAGIPHDNLAQFSKDLVQTGLDLGSFYNVDPGTVFQDLRSGLTGEVEPLRKYGIFISEATLAAKAAEMGIGKANGSTRAAAEASQALRIAQSRLTTATGKYGKTSIQAASASLSVQRAQDAVTKATAGTAVELTDQQKVMVRQRLIMDQLGDAHGDLERTSGSLANQWRAVTGRLQEGATVIGNALLPTADKLTISLNRKLQPAIGWLQTNAPIWADKLGKGMSNVADGATGAWRALNAEGFRGMASFIDESVHAHGRLRDILDKVYGIARDVWAIFTQSVLPAFRDLNEKGIMLIAGPLSHLDDVTHFLADHTSALRVGIEGLVGVMILERGLAIGTSIVQGVLTTIRVAAVFATSGYAAAVAAATAAEASEAVAGGVLSAVLGSHIVALGFGAAAWLLNAATVGAYTVAIWANVAAEWAWKALNLIPFLVDVGIQVAINTAQQVGYGVALVASTAAQLVARGATLAWAAAQWALNAALYANPIVLIVVGIVALIAVIVLAYQHSRTFQAIVTGAFLGALAVVMAVWGWVRNNWPLLLGILTGPVGLAVAFIITHWEQFLGFFRGIPGAISAIAGGMWNGIQEAFKGTINWIIRVWNGLEFKIPGFHVGPVGFDGFTLGMPDIPELHSGGTTTTGGMVNMRPDEELVVLPAAASVIPLPEDHGVIAGSGGDERPIVVQLVVDKSVLAEKVIDRISDKQARR